MSTVTIALEKVREAAQTSPEARRALEVLCPEAFGPTLLSLADGRKTQDALDTITTSWGIGHSAWCRRGVGSYKGKGIFLGYGTGRYKYSVKTDDEGAQVLICEVTR
jgi:hypothetical protein